MRLDDSIIHHLLTTRLTPTIHWDETERANWQRRAKIDSSMSILSGLLFEMQLAAVPQNRTAMPKSPRRVYLDGAIPMPNPMTLLAWQSICEIASGYVGEPVVAIWGIDSESDGQASWPPVFHIPTRQDHWPRLLYWTLIQIPTLGDGSSETHIEGSLPPASPLIRDEAGYGYWNQVLMQLYRRENGVLWWKMDTADPLIGVDTAMPTYSILLRGLEPLHITPYYRTVANRLMKYWAHPQNVHNMSQWKAPAAFPTLAVHGRNQIPYPNWGIRPQLPPHQHFYRLMEDHDVGMRFSKYPIKWLEAWQKAVEFQIDWLESRITDTFDLEQYIKNLHPQDEDIAGRIEITIDSMKDILGL